jgi:Ser/Thr protein kinase RdoA (MazF antagonist)
MDLPTLRAAAVEAAVQAGAAAGYPTTDAVVLQDSNNVVLWLRPHAVVAKVGIWPHSWEVLEREVRVGAHLSERGAPVAAPIGELRAGTAHPVSLWTKLEPSTDTHASAVVIGQMLGRVHASLRQIPSQLPSYLGAIDLARATLLDDRRMGALARDDLRFLRESFDHLQAAVRRRPDERHQPLHGEPHDGNIIVTEDGPRLIDFEAACVGPLEWDLASTSPGVAATFADVDDELLALLQLLNSARVATWCWAQAEHPAMRPHALHHLAVLRAAAS